MGTPTVPTELELLLKEVEACPAAEAIYRTLIASGYNSVVRVVDSILVGLLDHLVSEIIEAKCLEGEDYEIRRIHPRIFNAALQRRRDHDLGLDR